jgi:hypothetical protein
VEARRLDVQRNQLHFREKNMRHCRIASFAALLLISAVSHAYETIPGATLTTDLVLQSNKTYYIEGRVLVPELRKVIINAGAVVKVRSVVNSGFDVHGAIEIRGSESHPVIFTSSGDDSVGNLTPNFGTLYSDIVLRHDVYRTSRFEHVEFRYTRLDIGKANVTVNNVSFANKQKPFTGGMSPSGSFANIRFAPTAYGHGYILKTAEADQDTWQALPVPYIASAVNIPVGKSLTILPGATFRGGSIDVSGQLNIGGKGAGLARVLFAGVADSRYPGLSPLSGENYSFNFLRFRPGSFGILRGLTIAYLSSTSTALIVDGASPDFDDLRFDLVGRSRFDNYSVISVLADGAPSFRCVDTNASGPYVLISNRSSAAVDFVDGYWLSPEGPLPYDTTLSPAARYVGDVRFVPFRASRTEACDATLPGSLLFDVDGDGEINPHIDGLLIIRYMAGRRGDELLANSLTDVIELHPAALRRTHQQLEAYLADALGRGSR